MCARSGRKSNIRGCPGPCTPRVFLRSRVDGRDLPTPCPSPEARPDDTVCPAAVLSRLARVFRQGCIQLPALRVRVTVRTEPEGEFIVGVSFLLERCWGHDKDSVYQFVPPPFHERGPIKLRRRHQRSVRLGAELP